MRLEMFLKRLAMFSLAICLQPAVIADVIYQTGFEPGEGYTADLLSGQQGWISEGTGGNGITPGFFAGRGQSAYVGYSAPSDTNNADTWVWYPANLTSLSSDAVIRFSVSMYLGDSSNGEYDSFGWDVFSDSGRLLSLIFDNSDWSIWYRSGTNAEASSTVTFSNAVPYELVLVMDFGARRWSASLGGKVLAADQPLGAAGQRLTLADVDAFWWVLDPARPGNNFMVFDDYRIELLAANEKPAITSPPQSRTNALGSSAVFSVGATGSPPLGYQWRHSGTNLLNGGRFNDVTGTNLVITGVQLDDAGDYAVMVTNAYGSVTSALATLTVSLPVRTISLSGDLSFGGVELGSSAHRTLTIVNSGTSTLTLSSISYPTGFEGDWSGTIAAGASQNVTVTFSPSVATVYGGSLTVNSDATSGTNTCGISGIGVPRQSRPLFSGTTLADGLFQASLNGTTGICYVIEVSSNLTHWMPLLTNMMPSSGKRLISDLAPPNSGQRYYRALPLTQGPFVLQPGPEDGQDMVTASLYTQSASDHLFVGGWGDYYNTYLKFQLADLPARASAAIIQLYSYVGPHVGYVNVSMTLDRVAQDWDAIFATGVMRWGDQPPGTTLRTIPAPASGGWYSIDVTDLYNAWQAGSYPNYGIALRPTANMNRWNYFRSSRYQADPAMRPKLIVTP